MMQLLNVLNLTGTLLTILPCPSSTWPWRYSGERKGEEPPTSANEGIRNGFAGRSASLPSSVFVAGTSVLSCAITTEENPIIKNAGSTNLKLNFILGLLFLFTFRLLP